MDENLQTRPRIKSDRVLYERIEKFISPIYFADVNLYSRLYKSQVKIYSLLHFHAPGRVSFDKATRADINYKEVQVGESFGPAWSTHWFDIKVDLSVCSSWIGNEVRLRWNSDSEALVWIGGKPMQGLTGGDGQIRTDFILTDDCKGNEKFSVYIEMAANGMFGAGNNGTINPPDMNRSYTLKMVELAVLDYDISRIIRDLKLLMDINKNLTWNDNISSKALQLGCDVVNCFQPFTDDSVEKAKCLLDKFFGTSLIADKFSYNVHAIGHCHIDTAWLWPYAETERKCARSWSSVIGLLKRYPSSKFACSQAQQLCWVKNKYPSLYADIQNFTESNNFIPVGGTWVEMDGNLPSGESFIRQFLYGQRFFKKEFKKYCDVFWLPDTFGYSAQLPQIIRQSGIKYFLTQKISWSLFNKFPHNSFLWEGVDGSKCLVHFPPADTYESSVTFNDVLKTSTQNKDRGIVFDGMLLYGYGDGGGGPTENMIENIERLGCIPGLPKISHSSPTEFFKQLEKSWNLLHTWVGELYLELHQGTFTSQAQIKKYNRFCEILLHNTELYQVWTRICNPSSDIVPTCEIEQIWKNVLLNQFHDVLPGSCIKEVVDDANELYQDVIKKCFQFDKIHKKSLLKLDSGAGDLVLINCSQWKRVELISLDPVIEPIEGSQITQDKILACVSIDGYSCVPLKQAIVAVKDQVHIYEDVLLKTITLRNKYICATFNRSGQLLSCILLQSDRQCIQSSCPANTFCLYTDIPLYWDAWDVMPYNEESRQIVSNCVNTRIVEQGPLRASFEVSLEISKDSSITQVISLDAFEDLIRFDTKVNWHENRKMLKVEFPLDLLPNFATYEIQCGHIQRPTHCNTPWDAAKYEVCGQKWVDLSEHGFGVSLLNDSKYGFSCYASTLKMSLLRSPKAPDSEADMGLHSFSYALVPHQDSFQNAGIIRKAQTFNNPLLLEASGNDVVHRNLFDVDSHAVILNAIKMSEESRDHVILRFYESFGSRCKNVKVKLGFSILDIYRTNLLEDREERSENELKIIDENQFSFSIMPFEILTVCVRIPT